MSSSFTQQVYKTNVPGKARIQEEHGDKEKPEAMFQNRSGGDTLTAMDMEELEIYRSGKKPSKEFLEEKKRRQREEYEKVRAARNGNVLFQAQDKYLEDIAEINRMNGEMGMPKIRTEVRYLNASPEIGVQSLQTPDFNQPLDVKKPTKGKKKKGAKKASQNVTTVTTPEAASSQPSLVEKL